jgi:hypothetical protein
MRIGTYYATLSVLTRMRVWSQGDDLCQNWATMTADSPTPHAKKETRDESPGSVFCVRLLLFAAPAAAGPSGGGGSAIYPVMSLWAADLPGRRPASR